MLAALLLLTGPGLAGCLDGNDGGSRGPAGTGSSSAGTTSPGPTGGLPPPPSPTVVDLLLDFGLPGCRGITVEHQRALADVQALLPPGFTAKPVDLTMQAPQPVGPLGSLLVDVFSCSGLTVAGEPRVPATYYGQLYTFVDPPTERWPGTPDVPIHEYVFRTLAAEDVLAALWPAAGYDSRSGPAALAIGAPGGLPLQQGPRLANATIAGYTVTAAGNTADTAPIAAPFARYTALNDGSLLVWTGTYAFPTAYRGVGNFQIVADDLYTRYGESFAGGAYLYEGGDMADMDLRRVFLPL